MKYILMIAASLTTCLMLGACGEDKSRQAAQVTSPPATPPVVAAPSTPSQMPSTAGSGAAESPKDSTAAETAKDSPATQPHEAMTPSEESKSMPKPGQANNHSSTSLDAPARR